MREWLIKFVKAGSLYDCEDDCSSMHDDRVGPCDCNGPTATVDALLAKVGPFVSEPSEREVALLRSCICGGPPFNGAKYESLDESERRQIDFMIADVVGTVGPRSEPTDLDDACAFLTRRPGSAAFTVHSSGVEEIDGLVTLHAGTVPKRHSSRNGENALRAALLSRAVALGWVPTAQDDGVPHHETVRQIAVAIDQGQLAEAARDEPVPWILPVYDALKNALAARDATKHVEEVESKPPSASWLRYQPKTIGDKLGYLVEESGEVNAAVGKTLRWGLDSSNPEIVGGETNRDWLLRELQDLKKAIRIVEAALHEGQP